MSYSEIVMKSWRVKRYERTPRKFNGFTVPVYVAHRFPIKNGISLIEVLAISSLRANPLINMIKMEKIT